MSNFDTAVRFVLQNEGGFSNDKADRGGATNYGVSLRFLKLAGIDVDGDGHISESDVKAMTRETAIGIYRKYFWEHYRLENIRDVKIAAKTLDLFVNMRGKQAAKIIQQACNDCGAKLNVDGILGSKSFLAINTLSLFVEGREKLLDAIRERQREFYKAIAEKNKSHRKFLNGWLKRAAL